MITEVDKRVFEHIFLTLNDIQTNPNNYDVRLLKNMKNEANNMIDIVKHDISIINYYIKMKEKKNV